MSEVSGGSMSDVSRNASETKDIKNPNVENYKKIKPEEGTTVGKAENYWKEEFSKDSESMKNGEATDGKTESGEKTYLDDNGEVYRVGDKLEPNKTFEVNGYKFETDDKGRTISAEGKLRMRDPDYVRDMDKMDAVGKGDQKEGDQRGHLIGHQFEGSGGIENLVPMKGELNQGDYVKLENSLADAVKDGADVKLKVEPIYEGDSNRPTEFKVSYSIDGEKDVVVFRNDSSEVKQ